MKFRLSHSILICASLMAALPRLRGEPPSGPRLVFETNEFRFGHILDGEVVNYSFVLSNAGGQTLEITTVSAGCHCTTPGDWTRRIEPGKTGKIPIRYDSRGQRGEINRRIEVASNDKTAPLQRIVLRGVVTKAISASPEYVILHLTPQTVTNPTVIVHITNEVENAVTISEPVNQSRSFTAKLTTVKPGREFEVAITAVPPLAPNGTMGIVSLRTSLTNMPVLTINVLVMGPKPNSGLGR